VAFILPINGTIKFKHIVKVFAGGRAVSEQEAVDVARSYAKRFSIDVTPLKMIVTTDVEHDARAQRMDVKTGEFISSRLL
jgi:DNA-binding protein